MNASTDLAPIEAATPLEGNVLIHGMPEAEYFAIEALSNSGGKKLRQSPAHYLFDRTHRREPTPQMMFGSAAHAMILQPDRVAELVACAPQVDKRTKDGKAEWAAFADANAGKLILSPADMLRANACAIAVRAHPAAAKLFDGGESEVSLFWTDGEYGVPCKARLDHVHRGGVIDLKTTVNASPEEFGRSCATFEYHAQESWYRSGAEHVLNESPRFFAFVAVESEPPHGVAVYVLPNAAVLAGGHLCKVALERYAAARKTGIWPGYSDQINVLEFPRWALKFG